MFLVDYEEDTQILDSTVKLGHPRIKYNEYGIPQGISVEDFSNRFLNKMSEVYGTDFRKLRI
ncbi:hypothetical protein FACS189434_07500 [Bacteroidia bacterium]|nr:hypothetical protein FACS189434_07500 [Bacteroidia bacterium]